MIKTYSGLHSAIRFGFANFRFFTSVASVGFAVAAAAAAAASAAAAAAAVRLVLFFLFGVRLVSHQTDC